jgi:threonine dehydrogenase-like Zn-dependent dehydrogenase
VIGSGPIGLVIILILRAVGITNIITSEPSPGRRDLARKLGAAHIIDPTAFPSAAFPEHVSATSPTGLADVAFDCAGVPASLAAAFSGTRSRATVVNVAVWERPPDFPMNRLVFGEKTYKGTAAPEHEDFEGVLTLLRDGKLDDAVRVVTKKVKLADADREGFAELTRKGGTGEGKVLVEMAGGE